MNQNYDDIYLGKSLADKINDTKYTNLSDNRFEKYGKVGGLMVKDMVESYEQNLIDRTENKMR
ncbi:MAG: small, acid-soluble spore protein, alpha/beta type [Eubacteriaceae bacterium]|nr:small, acid-soluble spore protein, alpha/beta type [Eubacteriaceae bacterium]